MRSSSISAKKTESSSNNRHARHNFGEGASANGLASHGQSASLIICQSESSVTELLPQDRFSSRRHSVLVEDLLEGGTEIQQSLGAVAVKARPMHDRETLRL